MHPMLTKVGLEIFQCVRTDEDQYNVRIDIDIQCFSTEHIKWALLIGCPIIVIWSIGWPMLVFIILCKNRKRLHDPEFEKYFLILYQGLKDKWFYWELVNTIRKVIMVAINVFMSTLPIIYACVLAVVILIAVIRIQIRLEPYKNSLNNELEIQAMITGTGTLFAGVLFISDDSDLVVIIIFVLIIIIIMNSRYVLFWLFWMAFTLVEKHESFRTIFNMLALITCRRQFALKMISESGIKLKDHFTSNEHQNVNLNNIYELILYRKIVMIYLSKENQRVKRKNWT